jgi:hypothetical protein
VARLLDLVVADHRRAQLLFAQLASVRRPESRKLLAETLAWELLAHMAIEEPIFDDGGHVAMIDLIEALDGLDPEDPAFADRLQELERHVTEHQMDEELRIVPQVGDAAEAYLENRARVPRRRLPRAGLPIADGAVIDLSEAIDLRDQVLR